MPLAEKLGKWALLKTHHTAPIRTVANLSHYDYQVRTGEGVTIGANVEMRGDITVGDHATIKDGAALYRKVELGDYGKVDRDTAIRGPATFGDHTNILQGVRIRADLDVGAYTAIAHGASIQSYGLNLGRLASQQDFQLHLGNSNPSRKRPIEIGNDCYISRDAVIAPGVTIGDGAVVGAGAVVADDVAPYTVVAGNPAEQVSRRLPEETARRLLAIAWWEWSDERLQNNSNLLDHTFDREHPTNEDREVLEALERVSSI